MDNQQISAAIETRLLPVVERPMRYVGAELNSVRKDLATAGLHGVFCFPDIYDIGMSHHGLQILYHIVNRNERWALSRCFHPWTDAEKIMRDNGIPLWTLEYRTPIADADWLGFSLQYELQYSSVVNMLDLAGMPVRADQRTDRHWPLVVAGGPCMSNPEPLAEIVDAAVVGDGEEAVVRLCETLEEARSASWDRDAALERVARIPGVYVPSRHGTTHAGTFVVPAASDNAPVRAAKVAELAANDYPMKPVVPLIDVVHHRLSVEVMRGCTRGCRFCAAGMYYRPVRERPVADIQQQIAEGMATTGWRDVGLLSLSTADYSGLTPLLKSLDSSRRNMRVKFSLPSTRIDALGAEQIDCLYRLTNVSSITIAPEAGSQRLRQVINKGFTEEQILGTVDILLQRNIQTLKLYFMVGLPTETEEDIQAIVDLTSRIAGVVRSVSRRRTVHVAVSPFSPKPNTPFQWESMDSVESLNRKGAAIKRGLSSLRNVKVSYRDADVTRLETVIARGDRRVGNVILAAWKAGARLDGWGEMFDAACWWNAARETGVDLDVYTGAVAAEEPLPWSAIDTGVSTHFLRMDHDLAMAGVPTADCRGGECSACGVCTLVPRRLIGDDRPVQSDKKEEQGFGRKRASRSTAPAAARRHFRAGYRKESPVRFLGHRDMVKTFLRALLAADVPLAYSEGFHPHPRVGFGPPLPLGVVGDRELFDALVVGSYRPDLQAINRFLPEGLEVFEMKELGAKPVALSADMHAARYTILLPAQTAAADARRSVADLLKQQSVTIELERKGKVQTREIRPHVLEAGVGNDGAVEVLLAARQEGTLSPRELLRVLFPDVPFHEFLVRRTSSYRSHQGELVSL